MFQTNGLKIVICLAAIFLQFCLLGQKKVFNLSASMTSIGVLEDINGNPDSMLNWTFGFLSAEFESAQNVPGPLLEVNIGDTVIITFYNPSMEGHTIHLHGLDVDQVNDGVPHTSFYVLTGDTASYEFVASKAGTYMYHCHVTTPLHFQMGMYGGLIVKNRKMAYNNTGKFSKDHQLFLSEFDRRYHAMNITGIDLRDMRLDYILVNGKTHGQIYRDSSEVLNLAPTDTCLLRLVNASYSIIEAKIQNQISSTIIGSDGRSIPVPIDTNVIQLYPGERYGVLLNTDEVIDSTAIELTYINMRTGKRDLVEYVPVNEYNFKRPIKNIEEPSDTTVKYVSSPSLTEHAFIYPNPAFDIITYPSGKENEEYQITEVGGRIFTQGVLNAKRTILVSDLPSGLYLFKSLNFVSLFIKE